MFFISIIKTIVNVDIFFFWAIGLISRQANRVLDMLNKDQITIIQSLDSPIVESNILSTIVFQCTDMQSWELVG